MYKFRNLLASSVQIFCSNHILSCAHGPKDLGLLMKKINKMVGLKLDFFHSRYLGDFKLMD
jgi:hypothetical protein